MYVEVDFNLLYQLEKIAQRAGCSVTEIVNQAIADYIKQQPAEDEAPTTKPDDPA